MEPEIVIFLYIVFSINNNSLWASIKSRNKICKIEKVQGRPNGIIPTSTLV